MPSHEDINIQQQLLAAHRRTLALYLQQQAQLGKANTPPGIISGIQDARNNIYHIKAILRSWNVDVEDLPNDEEIILSSVTSRTDSVPTKEDLQGSNSVSNFLSEGYPDFTERFRKAKRISIEGVVLSTTVSRYNSDFLEALKRGCRLRFLMSEPTQEVLAMQSFRSSLIQNSEFMSSTTRNTFLTITNIAERSRNPELLELRMIPYVPPYSLTVIEDLDGRSTISVRIQSFQTPARAQPTFHVDSQIDSKWFQFFQDQFERLWDLAKKVNDD